MMKKFFVPLLMVVGAQTVCVQNISAAPSQVANSNGYLAQHVCQCRNCNLQHVNMSGYKPGSQLINENPFYKDNPYVDKSNKYIADAGWMNCNFVGADFSYADLSNSDFRIALRGYVTPLAKANFSTANLAHAQLNNAVLYGDDFAHAKLAFANLQHADLSMADFAGADFSGADLSFAISRGDAMHGWGADFRGANFAGANFEQANMYGDFTRANFSHAQLVEAKIDSSPDAVMGALDRDETVHGSWKRANFSYANLKGALIRSNGRRVSLTDTSAILCSTVMPDGTINNRNCPHHKVQHIVSKHRK